MHELKGLLSKGKPEEAARAFPSSHSSKESAADLESFSAKAQPIACTMVPKGSLSGPGHHLGF